MFVRSFFVCLIAGVLCGQSLADPPSGWGGLSSLPAGWKACPTGDAGGETFEVIPYPWLPGPDAALFCVRMIRVYALIAEKLAASDAAEKTSADDSLRHLIAVAQRCELEGDTAMAVNCYGEVLRLQPGTRLAEEAQEQLRRLGHGAFDKDVDALRRLLPLTMPLGLYQNGSVRLGGR